MASVHDEEISSIKTEEISEAAAAASQASEETLSRVKLYDVRRVKFPTLIQYDSIDGEKGLFEMFDDSHKNLFNLFTISLPPYFDEQYHNITLHKNHNVTKYLMGCVMWNEVIGFSFTNMIYKHHTDLKNELSKRKISPKAITFWNKKCTDMLDFVQQLVQFDSIPSTNFKCNPCQYLQNPCILMQVPFKPILLHQWLTVALTEVLLFEKESLEFRHWPLIEEINQTSSKLLCLIKTLKERIMLGFAILNTQIKSYPVANPKHPEIILNEIVLPSLPILEFLSTNKAYDILDTLKYQAFTENGKSQECSYISSDSYNMETSLTNLHSNFAYNYQIWCSDNIATIYPTPQEDTIKIIQKLKESKPYNSKQHSLNNVIKPLSENEKYLKIMMKKHVKSKPIGDEKLINLTVELIKEKILPNLPGLTSKDIEKKFSTAKCKSQAGEVFDERKTEYVHLAIRQMLMYNEARRLLIGSEKENTMAAQIISLQLQILEKEQLIRLSNTCKLLFKCDEIKNQEFKSKLDINTDFVNNEMTLIKNMISNQNIDSIWSKLPTEWKNSESYIIVSNVEEITLKDDQDLENFINKLLRSTGQIVYSIATNSFNTFTGNLFLNYLKWAVVQYILPCLLSNALELKNKGAVAETVLLALSFSHTLKIYAENEKDTEIENEQEQINLSGRRLQKKIRKGGNVLLDAYQYLMYRSVCRKLSTYFKYLGFDLLFSRTCKKMNVECALVTVTNYLDLECGNLCDHVLLKCSNACATELTNLMQQWYLFTYDLFLNLHIVNNEMNGYQFGMPLDKCPKFDELSFASAVLSEIELYCGYNGLFTKVHLEEKAKETFYYAELKINLLHRYKNNNFESVFQEALPVVHKYYNILKEHRKKCSSSVDINKFFRLLPNCTLHPEIANAVKLYTEGKFTVLDQILTVFKYVSPETVEEVEEAQVRTCRQCGKEEGTRKFIVCEQCVEQNYPDVNIYCGRRCQDARWKEEHMAEHLEFELDLGAFSSLNKK